MLRRYWPALIAVVVVIGAAIAIYQGHPDPLAGYGAILAALTLALQLQRLTGEHPDLRILVLKASVSGIEMLTIRAHNAGRGVVTAQGLGFSVTRDQHGPQHELQHQNAKEPVRELRQGGPRFEAITTFGFAAQTARQAKAPAWRYVWIEDGASVRHWAPIPRPLIAEIEQHLGRLAAKPG